MTQKEVEVLLDSGKLRVRMNNGGAWALRRNGQTQTWKTRPGEYRIPTKAGLRAYGSLTHRSVILDNVYEYDV